MAFASHGWLVFAIMPIFALGSIGTPALQVHATERFSAAQQGQLQGLLASSVSLASIFAPLSFSGFYFVVQRRCRGAVWLAVAGVNLLAMPFVLLGTARCRAVERPDRTAPPRGSLSCNRGGRHADTPAQQLI